MIKIKWYKGKNLGLALIYLSVMTLFQIIFIAIAQYGMQVGSRPITLLIPLAVIFATFYSVLMVFESTTTMKEFRQKHKYKHKKKRSTKQKLSGFFTNFYVKPALYVIIVFTLTFFLVWLISFSLIENTYTLFIIADNIAAIATIGMAIYIEQTTGKRIR